jgi:hypothetical protein
MRVETAQMNARGHIVITTLPEINTVQERLELSKTISGALLC